MEPTAPPHESGTEWDAPLLAESISLVSNDEVGCRPCGVFATLRYLLVLGGIIGGFLVIFLTPRKCPSNYNEDDSGYCTDKDNYECVDVYQCGHVICYSCAAKVPDLGAIVGGIVMSVAFAIFGCLSCCHHGRCILANKHYNDKVALCC